MVGSASVSLLVLRCSDIERSVAFYSALGLAFKREQHARGPAHYSCEIGTTVLELYPKTRADTSGLRVGLRVDREQVSLENIAALGGRILSTGPDSNSFVLRDPDRHTIELTFESGDAA